MNRRLCVWTAALGMGLAGSLAAAQDAPTTNPAAIPEISTATKGSGEITATQQAEIKAFITPLVGMVVTDDPAGQKGAVGALLKEAPGAANGYTAQYLDAYASALNQQILTTLKTQPPVRVRLNLAIVAAQVAKQTFPNSNQLEPAAEALLNDQAEAVALWGMKTAKFVLPAVLNVQVNGKAPPLLDLMVKTGLKFPGPVLEEAYEGLTLEPLDILRNKQQPQIKAAVVAVIPAVQSLLAQRVAAWPAGSIPKDPLADGQGTNFLVSDLVWHQQTAAQKPVTLHLMHDLLLNSANAFATAADKTDLTMLISRRLGGGFYVIADPKAENDPSVVTAAQGVTKILTSTPPAQVSAACAALAQAVEGMTIMSGEKFAPAAPAPGAPVTQGPTSRATSATSPGGTLAGIK